MLYLLVGLAPALLMGRVDQPGYALADHATLVSQFAAIGRGAVPHRDFADNYAGLAGLLAAPIYGLLGTRLSASLWLLGAVAAGIAWTSSLLLRRFVPLAIELPAAFAAGLMVVHVCVPYPGWMALVTALAAFALLARGDGPATLGAGLLIGCAGALKQTQGLFAIVLGSQWLVLLATSRPAGRRHRVWPAAATVLGWLLIVAVFHRYLAEARTIVPYLVPLTAATALVLARIVRDGTDPRLVRDVIRLVAGTCVVPALLLAWLASAGALGAFWHDQFMRSGRPDVTLFRAHPWPLPHALVLIAVLGAGTWILDRRRAGRLGVTPSVLAMLCCGGAVAGLVAHARGARVGLGHIAWNTAYWITPVLALWHVWRSRADARAFGVAAVLLALHLLVYPTATQGYLCYAIVGGVIAAAVLLHQVAGDRTARLVAPLLLVIALGPLTKSWNADKTRLADPRIDVPLSGWERDRVAPPLATLAQHAVDGDRLLTLSLEHWIFALARDRRTPEGFDLQSLLYRIKVARQPVLAAEVADLHGTMARQRIEWVLVEASDLERGTFAAALEDRFARHARAGDFWLLRRRP